MTNSLIDSFERMIVRATSPDGRILATYNNQRRLRLGFSDDDSFYEYDVESLTRQINAVLRALENGRQVGADELLKRAGFTESGSGESHWNANNRRYRHAIHDMFCFGHSPDGSIHFDADGALTDIEVEIEDDALNQLEHSAFLSQLHGAFADLLRDHADKRYQLKQQHNLLLSPQPSPWPKTITGDWHEREDRFRVRSTPPEAPQVAVVEHFSVRVGALGRHCHRCPGWLLHREGEMSGIHTFHRG